MCVIEMDSMGQFDLIINNNQKTNWKTGVQLELRFAFLMNLVWMKNTTDDILFLSVIYKE